MKIERTKVKRILLIKLRGIGDVILSTVVLENLKKDFPSAQIDFLTEPPSKSALEFLPLINEVIIFKKDDSKFSGLNLIRIIRKRKYDLVFDFYSNPRTALITFLSGAKYRAGFPYRGRNYAYNLKGPVERAKFHAAQLHLEFLKCLDLSTDYNNLHFGLSEDDIKFADSYFTQYFKETDLVIGISPSGGWPSKKCDPVKFAEIGDAVTEKYKAKTLLLWGPGDQSEAIEIHKLMRHKGVMAPLTDIRKMGALISRCNMLIANDSGPMHIATAVGTPTLSIHGPTNPSLQGPFGEKHEFVRLDELHCIECNLLECPYNHECFLELPLDRVLSKTDKIIIKNNINLPEDEKN